MECVDFASLRRGPGLDLIFPGWRAGERVAFYAPHGDDAALGAAYLIQAVAAQGGRPFVLVFCRTEGAFLELCRTIWIRRPIDFRPYFALLKNCRTRA